MTSQPAALHELMITRRIAASPETVPTFVTEVTSVARPRM